MVLFWVEGHSLGGLKRRGWGGAGFREMGFISKTAPFLSGWVDFRVFGWHGLQRGLGQMATCPFEAWADRDLPTWRQPNAALAPNSSQPREFPFAPKMAARVFARKEALSLDALGLFFEALQAF